MTKIKGAIFVAVVIACCGCGDTSPFPTTPVRGTVMYEDGTPIPAARVTVSFESELPPKSPKESPRTGRADVKPDGSFDTVTTLQHGDGAIIGPHKVTVAAFDAQGRLLDVVPKKYQQKSSTPLQAEVNPGGTPLEIRISRSK